MTEQIYRAGKKWRLMMIIAFFTILLLIGGATFQILTNGKFIENLIFIPFVFSLFIFGILGLKQVFSDKLIINETHMIIDGTFRKHHLSINSIVGYKIEEHYFHIFYKTTKKKYKIPVLLDQENKLSNWLYKNLKDLDIQKGMNDYELITTDERYGENIQTREDRLKKANKVAYAYNWFGFFTWVWSVFFSTNLKFSIVECFIVLSAGIFLISYFKGLIKVYNINSAHYANLLIGLGFPSLALLFKSFIYQLYFPQLLFPIAGLSAIAIASLVLFLSEELDVNFIFALRKIFNLSIVFLLFTFGIIVGVNCAFDSSPSKINTVAVVDKSTSEGSLYLTLDSWPQYSKTTTHNVALDIHTHLSPGDSIDVLHHKGLLNIPWYEIIYSYEL